MSRAFPPLVGLCVTGIACLWGCASATKEPQALTPADFASQAGDAPGELASPAVSTLPLPAPIDQGPADVVIVSGAPLLAPAEGASPSSPLRTREIEVDQLVGQINGRPVYADEFFAPMDQRFTREASRMNEREFIAFARKEIESALWDKLRDELLLSEFEGALTPEQKMGVLAFINDVRRDLVSGNLGSEALASQRLREAEGLGLEEKVQDVTQRRFILEQLRRAIGNRVTVSATDVRLYYEQHLDEFVPPPIARFKIMRVPAADAALLAQAQSAVEDAEPFEAAAARLSTWRRDAGNAHEVTLKDRDYATASLFGPPALNEAARALSVGQTSGRVNVGPDAYWIHLVDIANPPGQTLYQAQEAIDKKLRSERSREEEVRYFEQLFRRGSFSDVREMVRRLLEFAGERYLVQRPRAVAPQASTPKASTSDSTPPTPASEPPGASSEPRPAP